MSIFYLQFCPWLQDPQVSLSYQVWLSMASSASLSPISVQEPPLETLQYGDCPGLSFHIFLEGTFRLNYLGRSNS